MTTIRRIGLTLTALTLATLATTAGADRGHRHYHGHGSRVHFGITLGAPLWYPGPYYYPYPAYSYPAPIIVQPAPRVYVEREDAAQLQEAAPAASPYWYYCRDTNTYYPYVRECASPWERVPARPSGR